MADRQEDCFPQTSPEQAESQQAKPVFVRPPYLREDPWTPTTPPKDASHWTRVRQLLNKHDGATISSWQEEINTQLIVSTLLSGLTGAFVIETQKSLSEDPIVTAAVLLSHIATQLNASIALPPSTLQPFSNPPPNARVVNSLLYFSLGLSLSNVTLGLLCLQWLRELKADTPGVSNRFYGNLHSLRHTSFRKWGAKGLVSALPLLLLSSLTCFFAGLLCHVSTTDWVVSIPTGVVLGVTFGILIMSTLLPAVFIAGCAAFHQGTFSKSGGYPTIPPFQSLQSWISLQLSIIILKSPIFKKFITFPDSLRKLSHCPDWGRVGLHWLRYSPQTDLIILPLVQSSGNPSTVDDIALCLDDIQVLEAPPNADPVQVKIRTLRYLIGNYSKELPPHTLIDLESRLLIQLIHYFNSDGDFAAIGNLDFEAGRVKLHVASPDVATQLLHAMVRSYEHNLPDIMTFWDFFWLAMQLGIFSSPSPQMITSGPMLIIRALDVVGEYGNRHSYAGMVNVYQYQCFAWSLSDTLSSHPMYTRTFRRTRMAATIVFHPVWNELVSATRSLPPESFPGWLREALDNLDRLKDERALHEYAPLSFDWTARLYPEFEPYQPHIIVDMDSDHRMDEFPPSPVHLDIDDFRVGNPPPSIPPSTDRVELDGEGDMGPGDSAALNIKTMSTSNPSQAIRHDESGRSASSPSTPTSAYVDVEASEGLDVDIQEGDTRPTSQEAEERQETQKQEGGVIIDRHSIPLRDDD